MSTKRISSLLALLAASGLSTTAAAHMYTQFPAFVRGGSPDPSQWEAIYQDGAWGPVHVNIGHGCGHTTSMKESAPITTQVTVLIPGNNPDTKVIDYPLLDGGYGFPSLESPLKVIGPASPDKHGYDWGISTAQPEGIAALSRTYMFFAEAEPVYEKAARALTWKGDGIPSHSVGQIVFWVQMPEIPADSCVTDVQYFFPAAQFCPKSSVPGSLPAQAWLLEETANWTSEYLGGEPDQWAPYLRMRRDLSVKPLPVACKGNGQLVSVYPSKRDIDKYLKPVRETAKFQAKQIPLQEWISANHSEH